MMWCTAKLVIVKVVSAFIGFEHCTAFLKIKKHNLNHIYVNQDFAGDTLIITHYIRITHRRAIGRLTLMYLGKQQAFCPVSHLEVPAIDVCTKRDQKGKKYKKKLNSIILFLKKIIIDIEIFYSIRYYLQFQI